MLKHLAEQKEDVGKWKIQADILLRIDQSITDKD